MSAVEIHLAADGIEADVKAYDEAGKQVPVPHRIVISPYFFAAGGVGPLVYARVLGSNKPSAKEYSRFVIQLGGATGKLHVSDRSKPLSPRFLEEGATPASPEEQDDQDDQEPS